MGLKTVAILFVFGATLASGHTHRDIRSNGCPSAPELAPVICLFMKPHMGLFKPQLIAPSTYIPPLVVDKWDKPQLDIVFPSKKTIVIPEAPILPPITIPKFPVPVILPLPPVPSVEPCEPATIAVTSGAADAMVTGFNIPAAPILPPLEMPVLPEIVEVHGADMSEAYINDQSLMVAHYPGSIAPRPEDEPFPVPMPEFIQPLAPIPPAPELPEIPVHIKIPPQPIAPPMIVEQGIQTAVMQEFPAIPMIAPCPEDEPIPVSIPEFIQPLAPIPAPPMLPPARLPAMPVHVKIPPQPMPPMIIEHVEEPCITGEIVNHSEPMFIAQPPRIPQPAQIFAAHEQAIMSDPCEPAIQPAMKLAGHPYFIRAARIKKSPSLD